MQKVTSSVQKVNAEEEVQAVPHVITRNLTSAARAPRNQKHHKSGVSQGNHTAPQILRHAVWSAHCGKQWHWAVGPDRKWLADQSNPFFAPFKPRCSIIKHKTVKYRSSTCETTHSELKRNLWDSILATDDGSLCETACFLANRHCDQFYIHSVSIINQSIIK